MLLACSFLIFLSGTDLSPIQPGFAPPNLHFEIDDCCSEWVYPKNHFDYIHIRLMYGSVADWPAFYKEAYEYDSLHFRSYTRFNRSATDILLQAAISNKPKSPPPPNPTTAPLCRGMCTTNVESYLFNAAKRLAGHCVCKRL